MPTTEQDKLFDEIERLTFQHGSQLTEAIRSDLQTNSPLRTYGHVIFIGGNEIPLIDCSTKVCYMSSLSSLIREAKPIEIVQNGKNIKITTVPLFELGFNPAAQYQLFSVPDFVEKIKKLKSILNAEKRIWEDLNEAIPEGHVRFFIRTDATALPANNPVVEIMGYSIFENVGVAIFE